MPQYTPPTGATTWKQAVKEAAAAMLIVDVQDDDFAVLYANQAYEELAGGELPAVAGMAPWFFDSHRTDPRTRSELRAALNAGEDTTWTVRAYRGDGTARALELRLSPLHDRDGRVVQYLVTHHDRGEADRRQAVPAVSVDDPRDKLQAHLRPLLAHARRHHRCVGVLMVDLDPRGTLCGALGRGVLGELLEQASTRLIQRLRDDDVVMPAGEDRLAIVLSDMASHADLLPLCELVQRSFAEPLPLASGEVVVTPVLGASAFPRDGVEAGRLLDGAEVAMHGARADGLNGCRFFSVDLQTDALQRLDIQNGLRRALRKDELHLHYQPKIDLDTGRVSGMEALLRWQRPEQGAVSPGVFIPVAEESDLIIAIGEWVLHAACEQTERWRRGGLEPGRVSINLSGRHFRHPALVPTVKHVLRSTGLPPELLEIELTEGSLMGEEEQTLACLRRLHEMGVFLSVDDFGTGYSSLSYLKRFPLHALKVDRAFVESVADDERDREIARTIIAMAHALELGTVAEGVERSEQLGILRELECDEVQGFLLARPMPPEQLQPVLQQGITSPVPLRPLRSRRPTRRMRKPTS
jgi:diguanylate cyclase (GGDEF)-like protein/PAS domain S-box-containing protein